MPLSRLRSFWQAVSRRDRFESELDDELKFHLEARADDLVRGGLTRTAALRQARLELGASEAYKDDVRAARGLRFLDELRADLKFACRSWRKHAGLTLAVTATLALGIGVSTAGFTLVEVVFFRPQIAGDPRGHAQVYAAYSGSHQRPGDWWHVELDDLRAIERESRTLTRITGARSLSAPLGQNDPGTVSGLLMTCGALSAPAAPPPIVGRVLDQSDCAGAAPVMVLSEALWRGRFAADPGVVGRALKYGPLLLTVVGVSGARDKKGRAQVRVYLPATLTPAFSKGPAWAQLFEVRARLAEGATHRAATAELALILARQDRLHPGRRTTVAVTNGSIMQRPGRPPVLVFMIATLMAVVAMIVALVSANVVTLLLARAHARRHEIGVRLALGAGRGRLMKMLLTETLLVATAAAALSLPLSQWLPRLVLVWLEPGATDFPFPPPSGRAWTFLAAVTVLAAISTGLAPALEALKVDLVRTLKGAYPGAPVRRPRDLRGLLITTQVAFSVALLAGAALFIRAYSQMTLPDLGFETRHTLEAPLRFRGDAEPSWPSVHDAIAAELAGRPGIEAVAFSRSRPPGGERLEVRSRSQARTVQVNQVSPGFFTTLQIPLVRGRALDAGDPTGGGSIPVVVAQATAQTLWPDLDPVGQTARSHAGERFLVVGVSGDIRSPKRSGNLVLYRPLEPGRDTLLVRFAGSPAAAAAQVGDAIRRALPGLHGSPRTFRERFDESGEELGRAAVVAGGLGGGALALALIGVYGVVSFSARRQMKEMGIRLALGAERRHILRALLLPIARRVGAGVAVGLLVAAAGSPALRPLVGDLDVANPLVYLGAALAMGAAAFAAMLRPARLAMAADPTTTLRED